jgi:hypothetical protein
LEYCFLGSPLRLTITPFFHCFLTTPSLHYSNEYKGFIIKGLKKIDTYSFHKDYFGHYWCGINDEVQSDSRKNESFYKILDRLTNGAGRAMRNQDTGSLGDRLREILYTSRDLE